MSKCVLFLFPVFAVLVACSGDESQKSPLDADTGEFQTDDVGFAGDFAVDVDPERSLDSLSEEELAEACEASKVYYAESGVHAAQCLVEGYGFAELTESMDSAVLRQACADRVEICLEDRARIGGLPQLCGPTSPCTATLLEAWACVVDAGQGIIIGTEDLPSCEELTFEDLRLAYEFQQPSAPGCGALNATCN